MTRPTTSTAIQIPPHSRIQSGVQQQSKRGKRRTLVDVLQSDLGPILIDAYAATTAWRGGSLHSNNPRSRRHSATGRLHLLFVRAENKGEMIVYIYHAPIGSISIHSFIRTRQATAASQQHLWRDKTYYYSTRRRKKHHDPFAASVACS
jgi:hypothetical protein